MADEIDNENLQDAEAEAQANEGAQAEQAAPKASITPPAEPAEQLSSKERRRRARSTHSGEARATRTPEERHTERVAERHEKAVRRRRRRLQERAKAVERRAGAPAQEPLPPVHAPVEGARKLRQGVVVSDKADKTITVRIDIARRHRRYDLSHVLNLLLRSGLGVTFHPEARRHTRPQALSA